MGRRRGHTEGMLSHCICHCRLSGSLPGVRGCPHIQAVSMGCVWRGLEKTMWKLEMGLGRGCQVCAPMELPYTAPAESRVRRGEELLLLSCGWSAVHWQYSSCRCCHAEAMHGLLWVSPFHLHNMPWSHWHDLFLNGLVMKLLHAETKLLIPGHSAERWLYLDMTGLLFNWTKLMSKLPLKRGAPWLLVMWQCLSHSQTGL